MRYGEEVKYFFVEAVLGVKPLTLGFAPQGQGLCV